LHVSLAPAAPSDRAQGGAEHPRHVLGPPPARRDQRAAVLASLSRHVRRSCCRGRRGKGV